MLDYEQVNDLRSMLVDRFTAEELCDILKISTEDFFDKFIDEILNFKDWDEYL